MGGGGEGSRQSNQHQVYTQACLQWTPADGAGLSMSLRAGHMQPCTPGQQLPQHGKASCTLSLHVHLMQPSLASRVCLSRQQMPYQLYIKTCSSLILALQLKAGQKRAR